MHDPHPTDDRSMPVPQYAGSRNKAARRLLPRAEAWAHAKAASIKRTRSIEVLALLGDNSNSVCERNHVMDASGFLKFITRSAELSSLGMAGM